MYRITFNEITKNAVKDSLKHARDIDMNLVDAQQARRVSGPNRGLQDQPPSVGKGKKGLECRKGTVRGAQDDRGPEEEISAFIPEEYWTLEADFSVEGEKKPLRAKFYGEIRSEAFHQQQRGSRDDHGFPERRKFPGGGCEEGREDEEGSAALYHQYSSAGGIEGSELFDPEDHEDCPAAL